MCADANHEFPLACHQASAVVKHARIKIYGSTPTLRTDEGATEVSVSRLSAGKFEITARNGGNRRCHLMGVIPISLAKMYAIALPIQQVTTVLCTAEDANTTLHEKGFVVPFFDHTSGRPRLLGLWFDIDTGGVQPTLTDGNGTPADVYAEVTAVNASDSASQVATAAEAILENFARDSQDIFTVAISTATLTITDNEGALVDNRQDAANNRDEESTSIDPGAGTSGFTVTNTTPGKDSMTSSLIRVGFHDDSAFADPDGLLVSYMTYREDHAQ